MARLIDQLNIAIGFVPVDMKTAANAGDWVSLKDYESVLVVLVKAAGAAGEPPVLTLAQATAAAGTGTKALTFTRYYKKDGADLQAIAAWTEVTQAAAATATAAAGDTQTILAVEIKADDLDVSGGFYFVQGSVADVGATAQLGTLLYILGKPRLAAAPASQASAIA